MKKVYSYIRWSSDAQTWGDSERRQEQLAKDYCTRKGLKLSDQNFADRGVSARQGKNRMDGAFGDLLKVAKAGDTILIEDNDRFSREDPVTALVNLREIVNKDISVVFLKTGVEVNRTNFNDASVLFPNFFQGYLANQENEKKSFRLKQSWEAKRQQVRAGKPVKQKLPFWLQWDEQLGKPVVLEHKAVVVRRIFKLCLSGNGMLAIAHVLHDTPLMTRNPSKGWSSSFVRWILTNKAVLGYCTWVEPIMPHIYPPIIDERLFYAANAKIQERKTIPATVPRKFADSNLFTGLCRCSRCGSNLTRHIQKHDGRTYEYLVCGGSKQGVTKCNFAAVPYPLLERSFISLLAEGDLIRHRIAEENGAASVLAELTGKLADTERQIAKLLRLTLEDDAPSESLVGALKNFEDQKKKLVAQVEAEAIKLKVETGPLEAYEKFKNEFAGHMGKPEFRSQVRNMLRSMVEKIVVELGQKCYHVYLRGGNEPITVILGASPDGWLFSPTPIYFVQQNALTPGPSSGCSPAV